VLVETNTAYGRGILTGLSRFAQAGHRWDFRVWQWGEEGSGEKQDSSAEAGNLTGYDGILGLLRHSHVRELIRAAGIPAVNVSGTIDASPFPSVISDDRAVGRLAAGHFLERGFRYFAYCGEPHTLAIRNRWLGYSATIEAAGHSVRLFERTRTRDAWEKRLGELVDWVRTLSAPAAVFAFNDYRCRQVAEACRAAGLAVPGSVALLGVDNDTLACELCLPPLSSIELPAERIGYEAAELLERILGGRSAPKTPILLPPLRVIVRQSSDLQAVADPDLVATLRQIKDRAHRGANVSDLMETVSVSRRGLERRFKQHLGCSPAQALRKERIRLAKDLLLRSDLAMPAVASASGFSSAKQLCVTFTRETGVNPTEYRRRERC
jgi:LacI family transcriptional regulator